MIGSPFRTGAVCWVLLLLLIIGASGAPGQGNLLVNALGALLLIQPDGSQQSLAQSVTLAVFSPDGSQVAYVTRAQNLIVVTLATRATHKIVKLPLGAHFGRVEWSPQGTAVAYEALQHTTDDDLFLANVKPKTGEPRNLGHWSHGFSFSPDGKQILHPVSAPAGSVLERLDLSTGTRSVVHEVDAVVWDAGYSPDGKLIAYRVSLRRPDQPRNYADCAPTPLGLRVYSLATKTDIIVTIHDAPANWDDVKTYSWSPDSKSIAVTLAPTACEFPGTSAGIFVTAVDSTSQRRLSPSGISFEPQFSPDGSAVAFVDASEPFARLLRYDLGAKQLTLIRRASGQQSYYRLLGWR